MIRFEILALAAVTAPVIAQTIAPPPTQLPTWLDLAKCPHPTPDATVAYGPGAERKKVDVWNPQGKAAGDRTTLSTGDVELIAPETAASAETKRAIKAALK